jgi:hypothetical protein
MTVQSETERRTSWELSERPLAELVRDLSHDSVELVKKEGLLLRYEIDEKITEVKREAMMVGLGGGLALSGVGALVAFLILVLDLAMPDWAAALLVGALLTLAGIIALAVGKNRFADFDPVPRETTESVKQDVRALREAMR